MPVTRLSLINEFSGLAGRPDVNIGNLRLATGSDPRIDHHLILLGCGSGRSCSPRDARSLVRMRSP